MIRYLVDKGADINDLSIYGKTMIARAEEKFRDDAHDELKILGAVQKTDDQSIRKHFENAVQWLCQEFSAKSSSQESPQ